MEVFIISEDSNKQNVPNLQISREIVPLRMINSIAEELEKQTLEIDKFG